MISTLKQLNFTNNDELTFLAVKVVTPFSRSQSLSSFSFPPVAMHLTLNLEWRIRSRHFPALIITSFSVFIFFSTSHNLISPDSAAVKIFLKTSYRSNNIEIYYFHFHDLWFVHFNLTISCKQNADDMALQHMLWAQYCYIYIYDQHKYLWYTINKCKCNTTKIPQYEKTNIHETRNKFYTIMKTTNKTVNNY